MYSANKIKPRKSAPWYTTLKTRIARQIGVYLPDTFQYF